MLQEALEADFEKNLAREIILISKEMGWTIDYVLKMPILRYREIIDAFKYWNEKAKEQTSNVRNTFR